MGIIQASKVDYQNKDIVIGMLQSLSSKEYDVDKVFGDFGFTVVDECHHIAAEVFSRSLPKVNSYFSLGLSATPKRADGLSHVFEAYLGPMVYKVNQRDDKLVRVNIIKYSDNNPTYSKEELTNYGKLCIPRMINNIVGNFSRNLLTPSANQIISNPLIIIAVTIIHNTSVKAIAPKIESKEKRTFIKTIMEITLPIEALPLSPSSEGSKFIICQISLIAVYNIKAPPKRTIIECPLK